MRRRFIFIAAILVAALAFYWIKCKMEIDLFPSEHLSAYLPVSWLNKEDSIIKRLDYSRPGSRIWQEDFEVGNFFDRWGRIWSEKKTGLRRFYSEDTQRKSRCLTVENPEGVNWSLRPQVLVEVREGDHFRLTGLTKAGTSDPEIFLAIVLYDADRNVLNWSLVKIEGPPGNDWGQVSQDFIIPGSGAYIQIRLTGQRIGASLFDDLELIFLDHA